MFFILWILLSVIFIIIGILWSRRDEYSTGAVVVMVFSCFSLLISIIVPIATYTTNVSEVQNLASFYRANSQIYSSVYNDTKSMLSVEQNVNQSLIPIQGSIEKQAIGTSASERLAAPCCPSAALRAASDC